MTQLNRLDQGGRIDRSHPLGFRFDGVGQRCPIVGERHLRYVY